MIKKLVLILSLFIPLSCSEKKEEEVEPFRLEATSFSDLSGFENEDFYKVKAVFLKNCQVIENTSKEFIGEGEAKIKVADYKKLCLAARDVPSSEFKEFIKQNFVPYKVFYEGSATGKFTSYYEAEIRASYNPDAKYKYAIYGLPQDLVEVNLRDFDAALPAQKIVGRVVANKLVPYYTRAEIHQNGVNAPTILWGDSDIDIYIMQIQGSAVAKLPDGTEVRISYAGNNGRQFKGIGSILLSKGLLPSGQASMGGIKKWLKANPDLAIDNMNENERYIFHRLSTAEGPIGAYGLPLSAGRSLAVDKHFIPLGSMLWLETTDPDKNAINKIVFAQDIGGAIKGGVRGDYFWGSGGDDVLDKAGRMNSSGRYFLLLPKNSENNQ